MQNKKYVKLRCLIAMTVAIGSAVLPAIADGLAGAYINPNYLNAESWTYLGYPSVIATPWGVVSQWIYPWRAYQTTTPASQFIRGVGINFNTQGLSADVVAEMLAKHGIKCVRIDVGWGDLDYGTESTIIPGEQWVVSALQAAKKWGLRPLLVLNSNQNAPCPYLTFTHVVKANAAKGATTVQLDGTSNLTVGYSGIANLSSQTMNEVLVTAINSTTNTVTLSQPLPVALTAGQVVAMDTFKYVPFDAPGDTYYNAAQQAATLAGWNKFVSAIAVIAAQNMGTSPGDADMGFDIEIWNEVTLGSQFLILPAYYGQQPTLTNLSTVITNIETNTVTTINAHSSAFAGAVVEDGFANENSSYFAGLEPARVGALGKHLYPPLLEFPLSGIEEGGVWLNALLQLEYPFQFIPTYNEYMPEYQGTFQATPSPIQDLCPFSTYDAYGNLHGENSRVINGQVVPCTVFVSETGVMPAQVGVTDSASAMLLKAKGDSRLLAFYLNKGASEVDLFAASGLADWDFGILSNKFVLYATVWFLNPNPVYPNPDTPYVSPALTLIGNMVSQMQVGLDGSINSSNARPLNVTNIVSSNSYVQFNGDGTTKHPPGYDRELFAFLPCQVNAHRFVIPYYVMTVNIAQPLAPETFTIDFTGVNGTGATITAYDPLNNVTVPVTTNSASSNEVNLTLTAADYPYLLIVQEAQ